MFQKITKHILKFWIQHKIISSIVVAVLLGGGYYGYATFTSTEGEVRYVLAEVKRITITTSVSGSGQVSASNQVDIKPKASGDVVWVGIAAGQEVREGQTLALLDDADARKSVAEAELDLEETRLQFTRDTVVAPIEYERTKEALAKAKDDLGREYENSFTAVSNAFLDLPAVVSYLDDILYEENVTKGFTNESAYKNLFSSTDDRNFVTAFVEVAARDYKVARTSYDKSLQDFKKISRSSERATLEKILTDTIEMTKDISQSSKSEKNMLDTIDDTLDKNNIFTPTQVLTFQSGIKTHIATANGSLSALLTEKSVLDSAGEAVVNLERDLVILETSNPSGVNPISLQIARNEIKKKEVTLETLKKNLADYTVRSPFVGIIATVDAQKGEAVSSGSVIASLITTKKLAEISLNEVDAAKVKIGQKAELTFDAVEGLSISGEVVELDTVGAGSQGVVTYMAKVSFDTQEERVKPGMSASASIITDVKQDVLAIPNGAVKSRNNNYYVEVVAESITDAENMRGVILPSSPINMPVEVGISNDTMTEIISGVSEGEWVVARTIQSSTQATSQSAPSLFSAPGSRGGNRGGGGGGVFRTPR